MFAILEHVGVTRIVTETHKECGCGLWKSVALLCETTSSDSKAQCSHFEVP